MKLKMRFEKEDMIKFGIYTGILFFVVVFVLSIIFSFLQNLSLSNMNLFLSLSRKHIGVTFLIYFIVLIGLVASCKTFFFEFDKGFGFSTEKKMDGYNKWCDKNAMKKELKPVLASSKKSDAAGIVLINDGKTLWVDDGEYHNLVIGSTGSGKTQCVIFPMVYNLAKHDESMIITDPKGEIYEKTSEMLRHRGYNIVLLNFRNPQKGNSWNPLTLPYHLWQNGNKDKAIELLDDLALNILYDEGNKNADPFWEKTSAGYFSGIALGMFEDAKEEEININSISLMTTVGEEKFRGSSTYIKEYFNSKDPSSAAYINASSTILSPNETKGSILAVFKEKIKLFATRENLSEMLSHSDFSIQDIGLKKTAVFIVIQDEKKTYHSLATILVKQIYETLIDVAQNKGGRLPIRTNFLMDEFANMPPLKDVTTMITAARSRAMRFTLIIQNFAQLNEVYGEQNAETIKGNCGNTVYLISTELKALEEISKMCGEVKSKKDDKTASTPLITVSDLQKLKMFEVIIRRVRLAPFKTLLTPNYKMNWGYEYPKADINNVPEREKMPVQVFDVRKYVNENLKKKDDDLPGFGGGAPFPFMSGTGGNGLFGSPGGPNPFSGNSFDNKNILNNPISNIESPSFNSINDDNMDFDVDDIIKKIDAQIAKIEMEEKGLQTNDNPMEETTILDLPEPINVHDNNSIENSNLNQIINSTSIQKENNDNLNQIINSNNSQSSDSSETVSNNENDDYFDDFFDE